MYGPTISIGSNTAEVCNALLGVLRPSGVIEGQVGVGGSGERSLGVRALGRRQAGRRHAALQDVIRNCGFYKTLNLIDNT